MSESIQPLPQPSPDGPIISENTLFANLELLAKALKTIVEETRRDAGNALAAAQDDDDLQQATQVALAMSGAIDDPSIKASKEEAARIHRMASILLKIYETAGAVGLASIIERMAQCIESDEKKPFPIKRYEYAIIDSVMDSRPASRRNIQMQMPSPQGGPMMIMSGGQAYMMSMSLGEDDESSISPSQKPEQLGLIDRVRNELLKTGRSVALGVAIYNSLGGYYARRSAIEAEKELVKLQTNIAAQEQVEHPSQGVIYRNNEAREDMRQLQRRIYELQDKQQGNTAFALLGMAASLLLHLGIKHPQEKQKKPQRDEPVAPKFVPPIPPSTEETSTPRNEITPEDLEKIANEELSAGPASKTKKDSPFVRDIPREEILGFLLEMDDIVQLACRDAGVRRSDIQRM